MALTEKGIAKLKSTPGRYGDGALGLYLQVGPNGAASWVMRYERGGRERMLGLGPLSIVSVKAARERAREARLQLLDGKDPLEARRAERDRATLEAARTMSFKQCAEAYYAAHADEWVSTKHRQQFLNTMRDHVFPIMGSVAVAAIDEPLVLRVLTPIWREKTPTAKRVRNRIAAVLDYAAAAKFRTGTNPARWEGNLEFLLPKPDKIARVQHMPALPYAELPGFIAQLREVEGIAARALEFLILTAGRTGEVLGARWSEIADGKTWVIPAARMKAAKEHRVPLSERAVELLAALPREGDCVFVGMRPGTSISNIAMFRVLRRMGRDDITVHGFRSTFRDWAAEATSFPHEVCEHALAHKVGNAVERAYNRSDLFAKRSKLMEAWAQYCNRPATSGGVVQMNSRASRP